MSEFIKFNRQFIEQNRDELIFVRIKLESGEEAIAVKFWENNHNPKIYYGLIDLKDDCESITLERGFEELGEATREDYEAYAFEFYQKHFPQKPCNIDYFYNFYGYNEVCLHECDFMLQGDDTWWFYLEDLKCKLEDYFARMPLNKQAELLKKIEVFKEEVERCLEKQYGFMDPLSGECRDFVFFKIGEEDIDE